MYGKKDFKEKLLLDGFKNNPPHEQMGYRYAQKDFISHLKKLKEELN